MIRFAHVATVLLLALSTASAAKGELISGTSAYGWPNGRTSSNVPSCAVDGDLGTFTYTTESHNTQPGYLGIDLPQPMRVDRIRLYKDEYGGGGSDAPSIKNLDILYTSDTTTISLPNRQFYHVSSLTNGFGAAEQMNAASVNPNGTVVGDVHSSDVDGWASLSFSPVVATGIAIRFDYPGTYQHYLVYEFQVYGQAVPEPSCFALLGFGVLGWLSWRRRSAIASTNLN